MNRRSLLSGTVVALPFVSGCLGSAETSDDGAEIGLFVYNDRAEPHEYEITVYGTDDETMTQKRVEVEANVYVKRELFVDEPISGVQITVDRTRETTVNDLELCDPYLYESGQGELIVEHGESDLTAEIVCY